MSRLSRVLPSVAITVVASTCSRGPPQAATSERGAIEQAMQRYMVHARAVNADSVAALYTPNGTIFEPGIFPIQTRDSIRAFMASFPGVRVEVATADRKSTRL